MSAIVVLGMHRSGTSLVAGALHKMGIYMGSRFREPDSTSPYGYWEDLDWRDLNKSIINAAGGTWYEPPDPDSLADRVLAHRDEIQSLVAHREAIHNLWGMKDPRTSLLISHLHPLLPSPRYIVVRRNMYDVIDSLSRRAYRRGYRKSLRHWRGLHDVYISRIHGFIKQTHPDAITVDFRDFVHPHKSIQAIQTLAQWAGVDSEHAIDAATAFVVLREGE